MNTQGEKEAELIRRIAFLNDEEAFRALFYDFFSPLCIFARRYLDSMDDCEDVVQEVFYRIWKNRAQLHIETSVRNFLLTSVRNACLDSLRRDMAEESWIVHLQENREEADTSDLYTTHELEELLRTALGKLPEPIAETFRLNRFEGKTYTEIAGEKGLSVKTIEAYISKALRHLRKELKDYLPFFIGILG